MAVAMLWPVLPCAVVSVVIRRYGRLVTVVVHFLARSAGCSREFGSSALLELLGTLAWVWHRFSPVLEVAPARQADNGSNSVATIEEVADPQSGAGGHDRPGLGDFA